MTGPTTADGRPGVPAAGGAIACVTGEDGWMVPGLTAEELVASVPELEGVALIRTETRRNVSGFDMGPERMVEETGLKPAGLGQRISSQVPLPPMPGNSR